MVGAHGRRGLVHGFERDAHRLSGADDQLGAVHRRGPLDAAERAEVLANAGRLPGLESADRAIPRRPVGGGSGDQVVEAGRQGRRHDQHRRGQHDTGHCRADRETDAVAPAVGRHPEPGRQGRAQLRRRQPPQRASTAAATVSAGEAPGRHGADEHDHHQ
jgi:hypothetical protein